MTVFDTPPIDAGRPSTSAAGVETAGQPERLPWNPALEGIRGCAVLLVLMFHFLDADPHRGIIASIFKIAAAGWVGVDLFFVLSGFLITTILLRSKQSNNRFRDFYRRRVRRIFPLYYGVLVVVLILAPLLGAARTPGVTAILHEQEYFWLFASNFMTTYGNADWLSVGHFWSLAIEEQFYLLWPAIVFLGSRRQAVFTAAGAVAASVSLRLGFQVAALFDPMLAEARHWAFAWTPCRFDALAVGALVALASTDPDSRHQLERAGRIAALICLPLMAWLVWKDLLREARGVPGSPFQFALVVLTFFFLAIAFGALIIEATRADVARPVKWLASRPFRVLGKYSYGIYVFQGLLAPFFRRMLPPEQLAASLGSRDAAAYLFFFICSLLSLACAILSWHLYESRFLRPPASVMPASPEPAP